MSRQNTLSSQEHPGANLNTTALNDLGVLPLHHAASLSNSTYHSLSLSSNTHTYHSHPTLSQSSEYVDLLHPPPRPSLPLQESALALESSEVGLPPSLQEKRWKKSTKRRKRKWKIVRVLVEGVACTWSLFCTVEYYIASASSNLNSTRLRYALAFGSISAGATLIICMDIIFLFFNRIPRPNRTLPSLLGFTPFSSTSLVPLSSLGVLILAIYNLALTSLGRSFKEGLGFVGGGDGGKQRCSIDIDVVWSKSDFGCVLSEGWVGLAVGRLVITLLYLAVLHFSLYKSRSTHLQSQRVRSSSSISNLPRRYTSKYLQHLQDPSSPTSPIIPTASASPTFASKLLHPQAISRASLSSTPSPPPPPRRALMQMQEQYFRSSPSLIPLTLSSNTNSNARRTSLPLSDANANARRTSISSTDQTARRTPNKLHKERRFSNPNLTSSAFSSSSRSRESLPPMGPLLHTLSSTSNNDGRAIPPRSLSTSPPTLFPSSSASASASGGSTPRAQPPPLPSTSSASTSTLPPTLLPLQPRLSPPHLPLSLSPPTTQAASAQLENQAFQAWVSDFRALVTQISRETAEGSDLSLQSRTRHEESPSSSTSAGTGSTSTETESEGEEGRNSKPLYPVKVLGRVVRRMRTIESVGSREVGSPVYSPSARVGTPSTLATGESPVTGSAKGSPVVSKPATATSSSAGGGSGVPSRSGSGAGSSSGGPSGETEWVTASEGDSRKSSAGTTGDS